MNKNQWLHTNAIGYVKNLVAAERAVQDGQFNLAKVLRAVAYAQRTLAMHAARDQQTANTPEQRLSQVLSDLAEGASSTEEQVVLDRINDVLTRSHESLGAHPDVPEWIVAQFLSVCVQCGNLVEGRRPDVCDLCGALSIEFEVFGPFFAADDEHLGRLSPGQIKEVLARTPQQVEEAIAGVEDEVVSRKPSPEEWSVKELIGHIFETDALFLRRIDSLLSRTVYSQPVQPWKTHEGKGYESMGREDLVAWMHNVRSQTLASVAALSADDWSATGFMLGGTRSVLHIGTWLANHDQGHLVQIQRQVRDDMPYQ